MATTGSKTAGAVLVLSLADMRAGGGAAAHQFPLGTPATPDGIYVG